jgi:septal ring factor EnvC (AmiA/AmiB activator)
LLKKTLFVLLVGLTLMTSGPAIRAADSDLDARVKKPVSESIRIRQHTQKNEEQWRADRQEMTARYERLDQEMKQLREQRQTLKEKTTATRKRIARMEKQLADIEQVQARIMPLCGALIDRLHDHLDSDLPFLSEERRQRLQRLDDLRDDPEVAISEKFRKIMEALLVEAEYGNTIEVYQQNITVNQHEMLVNIFRLGRIGLFFQTLDQASCGFFNVATACWEALPSTYNRTIQAAVEMGAKRCPVELLTLPLGRMRVQ